MMPWPVAIYMGVGLGAVWFGSGNVKGGWSSGMATLLASIVVAMFAIAWPVVIAIAVICGKGKK